MTEESGRGGRAWRYPSRSEHPDDEIFIYDRWCKCCGICYGLCPAGVLTSDKAGRPVVTNPEARTACYLCEKLCPDMAITVHKERRAKADSAGKKEKASDGGGRTDA